MKEMIIAVCGASLFCAFISVMCPEGGLGRFVGFVASLLMLAVIFFSVADLDIPITEPPAYGGEAEYSSASDWLIERSAREIGRSVSEYIYAAYGYEGARVSVTLDVAQTDAIELVSVCVDLRHVTVVRGVYEIEAELGENLGCKVEVLVK
ncbi:MAG: hypothetical protein IJF74_04265 [Clostridia bacterium]|nr:hypothetical protein [Clostridia bacterium]